MLKISQPVYQAMLADVQGAYPLEACGLLAGEQGQATQLYPITNICHSPTAFEMDPRQQIKAMLEIESHGWMLLAMYHSHPQGPAVPSETDIAYAYYPDVIQLIISLQNQTQPQVGAFTIVDGRVTKIPLKLE